MVTDGCRAALTPGLVPAMVSKMSISGAPLPVLG